ncbi:hypothetical protein SELMODRAFT_446777 [Selaginella moellendorffii]|uniref:Pentacotripeptide-repeat region of PRORP domain-containing protein n=2 Tax=Selaginella moellendorffii TaxID=88036 RepID=D8SU93_SELML|nr:hypothetical protein SELMODRAFT_446777 [Selaginella moellendorffii]
MIGAYAQAWQMREARIIFKSMRERDIHSWSMIIVALISNNFEEEALHLCNQMPEYTISSMSSILQAFSSKGSIEEAQCVYDKMAIKNNVICSTAMLQAYSKAGNICQAKRVFDNIPWLDTISWSTMVASFAQNWELDATREAFHNMPERNLVAWNALMVAYSQAGSLEQAGKIFAWMPERDDVSWSTYIVAASSSFGNAIELLHAMVLLGFAPDRGTFLAVLGSPRSIEESRRQFLSMALDFGLQASIRHYCCILGALARSGRRDFAMELLESMPFWPDSVAKRSLLI